MAVGVTPGRKGGFAARQGCEMAPGFLPPFRTSCTKEVDVMTDYELLSLVIMIIMLVFAALSFYKNDK